MLDHFLNNANPQQKYCVQLELKKNVMVLAGAGSGKTAMLTARLAYLLQHFDLQGENVLALTFTHAAAEEMKERAQKLVSSDRRTKRLTIFTFHSFCFFLLLDRAIGLENWKRLGFQKAPQISENKQDGSPDSQTNGISLDTLMPLALQLLTKNPDVCGFYQKKIREILVDEYQDCSPDQLQLLKILKAENTGMLLVGDNFQAIYGFRGALREVVENTPEIFPQLEIVKLETNYRSTSNILKFANKLFSNTKSEFSKNLIPGRTSKDPLFLKNSKVSINISSTSFKEAVYVCREIQKLNSQHALDYGSFAILVRINALKPYFREAVQKMLGEKAAGEVHVETIHGSKGLQYPVVFVVGLEKGLFPFEKGGEKGLPLSRQEEEKRLFYVALTRAETLLYLSACKVRKLRGKYKRNKLSPLLKKECGARVGMKTTLHWKMAIF